MKLWPFKASSVSLEVRAEGDASYTDVLVNALQAMASGREARPTATGALEACAGFVGRAFAGAVVDGPGYAVDALTPAFLALVGRSLVRRGELVCVVDTSAGRLALLPGHSHEVGGLPSPDTWRYRVTAGGPSQTVTYAGLDAASVCHFRYSVDPVSPWRGVGPIQAAWLSGRLSAETIQALGDEVSGSRGNLLPIPKDGEDDTIDELKADIRTLRGKTAFVEQGDWGVPGGQNQAVWDVKRIGANPPQSLILQSQHASAEIMAAVGLNPSLFVEAQGAAAREAYRQALFSVIAPLGKLVASELSDKLDAEIGLSWDELRAADIASRARAFQSLIGGGMDVDRALAVTGLVVPDDTDE